MELDEALELPLIGHDGPLEFRSLTQLPEIRWRAPKPNELDMVQAAILQQMSMMQRCAIIDITGASYASPEVAGRTIIPGKCPADATITAVIVKPPA